MQIVSYDPHWPQEFEAERQNIADALGGIAVRIDHHGSTAVPGLDAKPIIDIQISVESLQPIEGYSVPLAEIGYLHVPHSDDSFCPFFHRPADWPHSHHVHVVQAGGEEERRTLAFRDFLREHAETAREYAQLKRRLGAQTDATDPSAREAYANAKSGFVDRVVQLALSMGYPRSL